MLNDRKVFKNIFSAASVGCLFLLSACFDLVTPPDSSALFTILYKSENFSQEECLSGINGTLRNRTREAQGIIRQTVSDTCGGITFRFVDEKTPFDDWIPVSGEEFEAICNENTDYYIVINDPEGKNFNSEYETLFLYFDGKGAKDRHWKVHLKSTGC